MKSGTVKESISRQLFDEQEEVQQNNNNLTMQSEERQQKDGGGDNMKNDDASHKNDNNDTSTTTQHNEQPMESQQDDGLDANELTSTLMGGDDMNQEEEEPPQQQQDGEDSSSSESDEESESSNSSSEEESDNDEGLSEYELLRKRNIKRNQKRLRKLGLLTDDNTSALSAAAAKSNEGESSNNKPKQVRKQQSKAPIQRRSLPRRKCAKLSILLGSSNENNTSNDINKAKTNGYESDESSMAPSPIKITRILHPQPHQKTLEQQETNLKQYKRTRRMKRGRPKREEYEYVCNESCKLCGGGWILNDSSNSNENVEEETRLIRCKDCRGAFHLKCMLAKDSDNGSGDADNKNEEEEEEDRKMPAASTDTNANAADDNDMSLEVEQDIRDPKRCYKCEEEYKQRKEHEQQLTSTTRTTLPILEATLSNNQTVRVRVTPEPLLEANVNGKDVSVSIVLNSRGTNGSSNNVDNITKKKSPKEANGLTCPHCSKEFVSQGGLDYHIEKKVCQRRAQRKKHVTWGTPLEEKQEGNDDDDDPTTKKISKIINKALADTDYAKLQDYSCAALRKHIPKDADKVVRLRGLQMLTAAMTHRE